MQDHRDHPRVHRRAALTSLAVTAALALLSGCRTEVAHDLSETDANRIVAVLAEQGIAGEILASGNRGEASWTVAVPASEGTRARVALSQREMPADPEQGLAEVFDRSGLVPTATEERARLMHAIQGELVETLQSLEGIVAARVHVSLPEGRRGLLAPSAEDRPEPSASVVIRHRGERPPVSEEEIRGIVAGAISDLSTERVTVVTIPTPPPSPVVVATVVPLGPFSVSPSSLGALRIWLASSSAAVGLLGIALVVLVLRMRSMRRQFAQSEDAA